MHVKRCEPSLAVNIHSVSRTTTIEDEAVQSAPGPSLKARGGALGAHSRPLSRFTSTSPMARSTSLSLRVLRIFFCPRHDGQLRCDVLEKFPPKPSRHEAGDIEDRLQLLVGEGERGHGLYLNPWPQARDFFFCPVPCLAVFPRPASVETAHAAEHDDQQQSGKDRRCEIVFGQRGQEAISRKRHGNNSKEQKLHSLANLTHRCCWQRLRSKVRHQTDRITRAS